MSYLGHGRRHSPESTDPIKPGDWHNIGDSGEPSFESSFANTGGSSTPMRYRIAVGEPNLVSNDGLTVLEYRRKQLEFQGDIDGGSFGDTVFTLAPAYWLDTDVPVAGHDSGGAYVPCRLYTDGRFVYGTP